MKRYIQLVCVVVLFMTESANAAQVARVPATPNPIEITQPDGSTLTILLRGDERHHYRITLDGYLVMANAKGFYCYAKLNCKKECVPSSRIAKNVSERSPSDWRYLKTMKKNQELYYSVPDYK